ncbi:MAG TPA: hypothetical protein VFY40_21700 [Blastocatellia bacterium]|nr:hypothetical protein [Blastocatellia bacterium]
MALRRLEKNENNHRRKRRIRKKLRANIATGDTRTVTTDGNGAYVAPQLKPALYRGQVDNSAFGTVGSQGFCFEIPVRDS